MHSERCSKAVVQTGGKNNSINILIYLIFNTITKEIDRSQGEDTERI